MSSLRSADQTSTGEPVDSSIDYTAPRTPGPEVRLDFVCQLPVTSASPRPESPEGLGSPTP